MGVTKPLNKHHLVIISIGALIIVSHGLRDCLNFWALNANSSKTVRATDFKFDTRVPRDSSDMIPTIFPKGGVFKNLFGGDMRERLLVTK